MKSLLFLALLGSTMIIFAEDRPAAATPAAKELPNCVIVIGGVRAPQTIRHTADLTLTAAVSAAGGTGGFDAWIYVIRNGAVKHKTPAGRSRAKKTEDIALLPWDIVCVGTIAPH